MRLSNNKNRSSGYERRIAVDSGCSILVPPGWLNSAHKHLQHISYPQSTGTHPEMALQCYLQEIRIDIPVINSSSRTAAGLAKARNWGAAHASDAAVARRARRTNDVGVITFSRLGTSCHVQSLETLPFWPCTTLASNGAARAEARQMSFMLFICLLLISRNLQMHRGHEVRGRGKIHTFVREHDENPFSDVSRVRCRFGTSQLEGRISTRHTRASAEYATHTIGSYCQLLGADEPIHPGPCNDVLRQNKQYG